MARLEVSRIKPRRIRDLISQAPEARVVAAPVDRSFTKADYSPSGDAKAIALLGDLLGNAAKIKLLMGRAMTTRVLRTLKRLL